MKNEIEVKFLQIDVEVMREKLQAVGAKLVKPMRLMRRAIVDHADLRLQKDKNGYIRVRDEGDKVTLTYKQFDALSIDGAKEIELTVSSFSDAIAFLEAAGLIVRSFQESKRETWTLDEAEVVIDEWPWLKPYIEVEADDEVTLKNAAERLGFDWASAVHGDVMVAYRAEYPHLSLDDTIGTLAEVRFGTPLPALLGG